MYVYIFSSSDFFVTTQFGPISNKDILYKTVRIPAGVANRASDFSAEASSRN